MRFNLKKILVRVGIGLLAICAVGLLVRAGFNYSQGRRLERTLRDGRDRGVPLTLRDIEPICRPEDNAARIWKAAEALFSLEKGKRALIRDGMAAVTGNRPFDDAARDELEALIAGQGDFLGLIRNAAGKSCFKYEEDWSMAAGDMKVPDAVAMIQGMRLLGIDSVLKAEAGRIEEALDQCRIGMRFLNLRLPHPSLIGYLISIAGVKIMAACQRAILLNADLDEAGLREVVDRFDPEPWRSGLSAAVDGERILAIDMELGILQGRHREYLGLSRGDRLFFWLFRPVVKAETIWTLGIYDRLSTLAEMPYYQILNEKGELIEPFPDPPRLYRLAGLIAPNWEAVFLKRASLAAIFDTIRLGAACRIHRIHYGEWPESLGRLVPDILEDLPLDPFTGDPYVYRRGGKGFIVYSLGSNRRDDGGRETWVITQMVMPEDDDWSWREGDIR